ncbi:MAG TPA: hypothetical protein VEB22_01265, partial [Phycisphaerales bacterium]|nr:hypothetical protein [Phycisphaerales bacterium]
MGAPLGPTVAVQPVGIEDPALARDPATEQLGGALDAFTSLVAMGGRIADRDAAEAERAADRSEREQQKADAKALSIAFGSAKRGAAQAARERLPGDIDLIRQGKFQFAPEDKGDPEAAIDRIANQYADMAAAELPEQHRETIRQAVYEEFGRIYARPALTALYEKQNVDRKRAMDTALGGVKDQLLGTTDPDQIERVMNEAFATIPGVRLDQLDSVAANAMYSFARDGNETMVNAFADMLGKRELDVQDRAQELLAIAKNKRTSEANAAFANVAGRVKLEVGLGQMTPESGIRQIIEIGQQNGIGFNKIESEAATLITKWQ